MMTRWALLALAALVATAPDAACPESSDGRLHARLVQASASLEPGRHALGLESGRDGVLYVPRDRHAGTPAPLLVLLHGAGGRARITETVQALADEFDVTVLAPDSRSTTWDLVHGSPGADVTFIDSALQYAFARCPVAPGRVAIAGFSDGASYALWLGTINGDLFTHVIAFSPGFLAPAAPHGSPRIFISHGTHDEILPIDRASRRIVPALEQAGYRVAYREFDGPHTVTAATVREAFEWFAK